MIEVVAGMPFEEYLGVEALSSSAIKKISVSIDDYLNADPEIESKSKSMGTAYHKAILEGVSAFEDAYCLPLDKNEYLCTVDDLKVWLDTNELPYQKSAKKEVLQDLCREHGAPIFDDALSNLKKEVLPEALYNRILRCAETITPLLPKIIPEVSIFWDWDGVPCKARFDGIIPEGIIDLKTYSNNRNMAIGRIPASNISMYRYDIQAVFYTQAYKAAHKANYAAFKQENPIFNILWVQTHDGLNLQGTTLTPESESEFRVNGYWEKANQDILKARELYNKHVILKEPLKTNLAFECLEDHHLPSYHFQD